MRQLLCLSLLLLPSAAAPDDKPAEDPRVIKPGHAPTPYTAEEIRAACPVGRIDVFRIEALGKVSTQTQTFVTCDEKGAEIESSTVKEDGTPAKTTTKTVTWRDLQAYGSFPQKFTRITEETIEVPAGKFDCMVYAVGGLDPASKVKQTLCFNKARAGPPVKLVQEMGGVVAMTMTLIECKVPEKKEEKDGEEPKGS